MRLLQREIDGSWGLESLRTITLETEAGPLSALCFYADPPPDEEVARLLAYACGYIGSDAGYLFKTVVALREQGIHDPHFWKLHYLVAQKIRGMHSGQPIPPRFIPGHALMIKLDVDAARNKDHSAPQEALSTGNDSME